jgi:hypothetical protein
MTSFVEKEKIPLTAVSGSFKSFLESRALEAPGKFPTRQCGDRSSPLYLSRSTNSTQTTNQQMNRSNLNDPQTAVWGILEVFRVAVL